LLALAFLFAGADLPAQNSGQGGSASPSTLGAEIQALEQRLASSLPPVERHGVLVRLARLRQLSGNVAVAANLWLEAVAINPADDFARVAGAYGLAAIGEWERAIAVIQPLLAPGRSGPSVIRARYLDATLKAWIASDISCLIILAGDPEAAVLRPIIYYTLWWTVARDPATFGDNAELWRQRLLTQYPRSPEARIAAPEASGTLPAISAIHSPLWLLLPGVPAGTPTGVPEGSTLADLMRSFTPSPDAPPQVTPPLAVTAPSPTHGQQTGLFRSETNARNHAETLRRTGFTTMVSRRLVNGVEHWAVVVPAENPARTAHDLRIAGYDSFTVRLD